MLNKISQNKAVVKIENIESMSIMGLILKTILERNLAIPKKYKKVQNLNATYNVRAGRMKANISFNNGEISISKGFAPDAIASVEGTLDAFMKVGTGGEFVTPFLMRKLKVSGNYKSLFPLLAVMRV